MCSSVISTTLKSWRERPPSSYSLKIQNLSQLEKSTLSDGRYQSRFFSSGGYSWRLIIYPKGNNMVYGSGYISMYVEIDSTSLSSTPGSEVFADLRFFVFNRKENKYFTIQDVESKSFNTLRTVWGLPQVLELDTFNEPTNGYIFEGDQCEFGVDVIIAPPPSNWEILSFIENFPRPKFYWTIENFSKLTEDPHSSNTFSMGGRKWYLKVYPKGNTGTFGKWLSIYLFLADSETLKEDEKINARGRVRVIDPFGYNHVTEELNDWHNRLNPAWGYDQFLSLAKLSKAYLDKEDTLNVEIEFDVVSETKYSIQ